MPRAFTRRRNPPKTAPALPADDPLNYWLSLPTLRPWEAVLISMSAIPGDAQPVRGNSLEYTRRLRSVDAHIASGEISASIIGSDVQIPTGVFARFAVAQRWMNIPERLQDVAEAIVQQRWPWGEHESVYLRALREAGIRFWSNPSNEPPDANEVIEFVKGLGGPRGLDVPDTVAKYIAIILSGGSRRPARRS